MFLRCQAPSRAFTRVELLIVVAILVIVAGLGVVGMRQVNDRAKLIQCHNNLKQIGLCVHNYHDVYKKVPPAWNPDSGSGTLGSNHDEYPRHKLKGPIHFLLLAYFESNPCT